MPEQIDWLPPLVLLESCDGDWERYLRKIYDYYKQDFVDSKPEFQGKELAIKRHPIDDGKEFNFWHIISEGKDETSRTPDLRRCERIRWPRPIIKHIDEPVVKIWKNNRNNDTRICIWFKEEYLVVLAERKTYTLFWTAYPTTRPHRKRKLRNEYEAFKKAGAA